MRTQCPRRAQDEGQREPAARESLKTAARKSARGEHKMKAREYQDTHRAKGEPEVIGKMPQSGP